MSFRMPPLSAAWLHQQVRTGFEVVHLDTVDEGHLITGCTTAVEDGRAWIVDYEVHLDIGWRTRRAHVASRSVDGLRAVQIEADGKGSWRVDGHPATHLDGCLDIDLESSAMTNALPVHRLALDPGRCAAAPAAYVRAPDLNVERLEQTYCRTDDDGPRQRYDYVAPAFGFTCELVYDDDGLVLTYPGLAARAM